MIYNWFTTVSTTVRFPSLAVMVRTIDNKSWMTVASQWWISKWHWIIWINQKWNACKQFSIVIISVHVYSLPTTPWERYYQKGTLRKCSIVITVFFGFMSFCQCVSLNVCPICPWTETDSLKHNVLSVHKYFHNFD